MQCPSLSSLAESVGGKAFVQIDVPLEIYVCVLVSLSTCSCRSLSTSASPARMPLSRRRSSCLRRTTRFPGRSAFRWNRCAAFASIATSFRVEKSPTAARWQGPQAIAAPRARLPRRVGCWRCALPRFVHLFRTNKLFLSLVGPASVGIFRRSPSASTVSHLAAAYDRGHPVTLSSAPDAPYIAASLLKKLLHDLPDPFIPRDTWDAIKACPLDDDLAVPYLRTNFLPLLPSASRHLLSRLLSVLSAIAANHSHNLMTSSNLVICLCPALMGGLGASRDELEMCRVPGMEVGSMRGLETIKRRERAGNTLGGVLRVMIDRCVCSFGRGISGRFIDAFATINRQSDLVDPPEPSA